MTKPLSYPAGEWRSRRPLFMTQSVLNITSLALSATAAILEICQFRARMLLA
jgi:hypothetical protein